MRAKTPKSAFLGGGTSVNSLGWKKQVAKGRVEDYQALIDVSELDMGSAEDKGEYIRFGGNLRFQDVLESPLCPTLLRAGLLQIANRNVRNMATLGGSLATKSPCSNVATALLALHAELEIRYESSEQVVALEAMDSCAPGGLIVGIRVPKEWAALPCATRRYSRSNNDISLVLSDVIISEKDGKVDKISAVAGGVGPQILRLLDLEDALRGREIPSAAQVSALVSHDILPIDDFRGSAEFKAYMIGELTDWCLHQASVDFHVCSHQ